MAELKRYRCVTVSTTSGRQPPWGEMQRSPDGQWVRYEDMDALLKERDEDHCFAVLDSAKLHGMKIDQLQRDLDAAYMALREFRAAFEDECNEYQRARYLEGIGGSEGPISEDEFTSYPFYVRHAETLKKAKEG